MFANITYSKGGAGDGRPSLGPVFVLIETTALPRGEIFDAI